MKIFGIHILKKAGDGTVGGLKGIFTNLKISKHFAKTDCVSLKHL